MEAQCLTIAWSQCVVMPSPEGTQHKCIYQYGFPAVASLALAVAVI